jgi:membrane-associated HD superfamily phosphohydrolase
LKHEEEWKLKLGAWLSRWKYDSNARFFLFLLLGVTLFTFVVGNVVPETYEFQLNERSPKTLTSPKQFVDQKATEDARQEAERNVVEQV